MLVLNQMNQNLITNYNSIREYAKKVEMHEKVMQFWNGKAHRMEVYVIVEDKFYIITGEEIQKNKP